MKKRIILTMMVAIALASGATDRFYIEDFTIAPGETRTVSMILDNDAEYTAFQTDICLPVGFMAANFTLTSRKSSSHTLSSVPQSDGSFRLLSYSLNLGCYSGNSGALVTFNVTAAADFSAPATIALRGTLFTTTAGVEVALADEQCTVTLPGRKGDVNNDGNVTIADVTALVNFLLSGSSTNINRANADMNGDNHITIADVTALINHLLTGNH